MKHLHLIAASVLVLAVMAVSTFYQGVANERWVSHNDSEELNEMALKMENPPLEFGLWEGRIIPDTDESLAGYRAARVKEHVDIEFRNTDSGEVMRVTLVCGHRRHVARHTPDQCMVGAGFQPMDENMQFLCTIDGGVVAQGRTMQFMKRGEEGVINQRMVWMWSRDGRWVAPTADVRVALSSHPAWYKLYVTMPLAGSKTKSEPEEIKPFIKELVPALTKVLFPDGPAKSDDEDTSVL
jgi:hypothetical protein